MIAHDRRAVLPNIDLITDMPWNVELSEFSSHMKLDIKPFSGIKPGERGRSSAYGQFDTDAGNIMDRVPDEAFSSEDGSWEAQKKKIKSQYPEQILEIDDEKKAAHADSENPDKLDTEPEDEATGGENGSWEAEKKRMKSQYPEQALEIDDEKQTIHADSENLGSLGAESEDDELVSGQEREDIQTQEQESVEEQETCACGENKECQCGDTEECGCGGGWESV